MTFFLNPLSYDFEGSWILGDRQQSIPFKCPRNTGRGDDLVIAWNDGPFDLSGNDTDGDSRDTLHVRFALGPTFERWTSLTVDVSSEAASTSAVTHTEIVGALVADTTFSGWFTASLSVEGHTQIRSLKPVTDFRFYIVPGRAEEALQFNKRAGVAEMPTYFDRHKFLHFFTSAATMKSFPDRMNSLYPLDPSANNVDAAIINNAVDAKGVSLGYSSATVREDYQLLRGRSGLFIFKKITVDGSDRITQVIEYHAGALAGDLAKKIEYSYTGANLNPDQITEIPYTLQSSDLVTP